MSVVDMNGISFQSTAPGGAHSKSVNGKLKREMQQGLSDATDNTLDLGEKLLNKFAGDITNTEGIYLKKDRVNAAPVGDETTGTNVNVESNEIIPQEIRGVQK
ncbi:MAG: hypothetical protein KKA31_00315 [Candidatus Margulisbacteria bacterium]|nr:hypothetical protein [Candidatus Margulisiibacteriota bacterium]